MVARDLERRVALLESKLAEIESALGIVGRQKNWRRAVEKYAGDPDLLAAFEEGKKLREADRTAFRRRG